MRLRNKLFFLLNHFFSKVFANLFPIFLLCVSSGIFVPSANAAGERIGNIRIESISFRPTLLTLEDEGGEFDLADSSFSLSWKRDNNISTFVAVGSTEERNLPIYYAAPQLDNVGFFEAYAQYAGLYGNIRFGLLPLGYSYDGRLAEQDEVFNESLLFEERVIGRRDYGLSYYVTHKGYFTELIAHNGEIDTESDGRLFVTGHWGWTDSNRWTTTMSLQTGSVQGDVSDGGTNTLAGVTNGESAKWRHGAFYVNYHPRNLNVVMQIAGGAVEQDNYDGDYSSWLIELSHMWSKNMGFGIRIDELDPNRDLPDDKTTKTHLALMLRSNDRTSNVYLVGTKVSEEKGEVPNDELRLVWYVTPFAN
jgi:hypothetical protein